MPSRTAQAAFRFPLPPAGFLFSFREATHVCRSYVWIPGLISQLGLCRRSDDNYWPVFQGRFLLGSVGTEVVPKCRPTVGQDLMVFLAIDKSRCAAATCRRSGK